jgi:hypothetical protein
MKDAKAQLWSGLHGVWMCVLLVWMICGATVSRAASEPVLSYLDRLNTLSQDSINNGAAAVDFSRWNYSSEHDRLSLALEESKIDCKYLEAKLKKRETVRALSAARIKPLLPLMRALRSKLSAARATSANLSSNAATAKSQFQAVRQASSKFSRALASAIKKSYPRGYTFPVMILETMGPPRADIFYRAGEAVDIQLTIANSLLDCPDFTFFPSYLSFGEAPMTGFVEVERTAGTENTTIHYRTTMTNYPGSIGFHVVACDGMKKSKLIYNRGHYQGEDGEGAGSGSGGSGSGGGSGDNTWDGNWSGTLYSSTPIGSGTNNITFTVTNGAINEENGVLTGIIDAQGNFTGQILLGAGISSLPLTGSFSGNSCSFSGSRTNVICQIQATRQ